MPNSNKKPVRVLVADDDLEIGGMLRKGLEARGFAVTLTTDGEEALGKALSEAFDLVILDVMMPGLNGWEVCKSLRERPELERTGILMLTAIGPNLKEMSAPLFGADDSLDKPFVFEDLEAKIASILESRRPNKGSVAH